MIFSLGRLSLREFKQTDEYLLFERMSQNSKPIENKSSFARRQSQELN